MYTIKKLINNNHLYDFIFKRIKAYRLYLSQKKYKNTNNLTICYDLKVSPPTIGDFIFLLIFLRFKILQGNKINFILINDKYRESWTYLDDNEIIELEDQLIKLLYLLIPNNYLISVKKSNFSDLKVIKKKTIIFASEIMSRKPMHNHYLNINNILFNNSKKLYEKALLTKNDFQIVSCDLNEYISWHLRYSTKWDFHRNINKKDFEAIGSYLSTRFPKKKILIISDKVGCEFIKKNNLLFRFNLAYSIDYTNTFQGCANLILNSKFYFQYRAGGMYPVAAYSRVPYAISLPIKGIANEYLIDDNKIVSNAQKDQIFIDLSNGNKLSDIFSKIDSNLCFKYEI